eukprot:CAMPEP_0202377596 /NCGR_PEP_ID=MMETSP1127-20130417/11634_1 /ASSEMBLY_ACC=CAM_ASM_000462 /TAXON_ID=3047 /ORGANISM="Dunaliella tertiolecta, Strain CCMP1320" /LENGTH=30 /DNA_ID= /DNA_START= /DNA_END= /DNA_ORIENTATION=
MRPESAQGWVGKRSKQDFASAAAAATAAAA